MNEVFLFVVPITISLATFFIAIWNTRRKAENDYVTLMEHRIADLEKRMKECEDIRMELTLRNQELNQQNTDLLRKIVEETVLKSIQERKKGDTK